MKISTEIDYKVIVEEGLYENVETSYINESLKNKNRIGFNISLGMDNCFSFKANREELSSFIKMIVNVEKAINDNGVKNF
jgi:hypothetical protein